jgi:hypothetical protein
MTFKCSTCNLTFKSTEEAMDHYKDNPLHEILYFVSGEVKE